MRRVLKIALAGAALAAATPASATLHGFCNSTAGPCVDNGTNTPTTTNPPNFGFWSSPGGETGTLLIDILIANNLAQPSSFTLTGLSGGPFTASIFNSTTAWTSGDLDAYLGVGVSGATPQNPIGAYIQPNAGQTGWWVYQANLGSRTLPGAPTDAFTMLLGGGGGSLPFGSYILGYLTPCPPGQNVCDATANSAAIREIGTPRGVPDPATWAMMLLGFGGIGMAMRRRRSNDGRLLQIA